MSCTLFTQVSVSMGGTSLWKVKQSLMCEINGESFVKLQASDPGFAKLVCETMVAKLPKNCSLSQCPGLSTLMSLRNSKQADELQEPVGDGAAALFGTAAAKPSKRQKRTGNDDRKPDIINVDVQRSSCTLTVPMVRPSRRRDDLCVPLKAEIIEHIVLFIREAGISQDDLEPKRVRDDVPRGVWVDKNRKGFIVKIVNEDKDVWWKRAKTVEEATAMLGQSSGSLPLCDGNAGEVPGSGDQALADDDNDESATDKGGSQDDECDAQEE
jgi:hypothetical protein